MEKEGESNTTKDTNSWTYTYTKEDLNGRDPSEIFDQFFNTKKEKVKQKKEMKSLRFWEFIFTYIYPILPFSEAFALLLKKIGTNDLLSGAIILFFIVAPIFLSGFLAVGDLVNKGWRYVGNPVVVIFVILCSFITSINTTITHSVIWITLISVYILGYFELLRSKFTNK